MSVKDLPTLEEICKGIIESEQPFERLEVSREELMQLFKVQTFELDKCSFCYLHVSFSPFPPPPPKKDGAP